MLKKSISKILCYFVLGCLIIEISGCGAIEQQKNQGKDGDIEQEKIVNEPHVYEILPGTNEWNAMTVEERRASCYVSKEEAAGMTTAALLETVLTYPYFIDIYAFNSIEQGLDSLLNGFPPMAELLERSDVTEVIQNYLDERQSANEDSTDIETMGANTIQSYLSYYRLNSSDISEITTEELLEAILDCPNFTRIYNYESPEDVIDLFLADFQPLWQLLERRDAEEVMQSFLDERLPMGDAESEDLDVFGVRILQRYIKKYSNENVALN